MQKTDKEDWEEIGEEVRQVREDVVNLVNTLNSIPKTVWRDEHQKAIEGMDGLKSVLEERLYEEHDDLGDDGMDVFYSEGKDNIVDE